MLDFDEIESKKIEKKLVKFRKSSVYDSHSYFLQKTYNINIYFKRGNIEFAVERWSVLLTFEPPTNDKKSKLQFLVKKLSTLLRSVYTLVKMLPLQSLFKKKLGFDYELTHSINEDFGGSEFSQFLKLDKISDIIGSIEFMVEYINKSDIFQLEDDMVTL